MKKIKLSKHIKKRKPSIRIKKSAMTKEMYKKRTQQAPVVIAALMAVIYMADKVSDKINSKLKESKLSHKKKMHGAGFKKLT